MKKVATSAFSPDAIKDLGNKAFSVKNYEQAILLYTRAIQMTTHAPNHIYFANRGNAYLGSQKYAECISDCDKAIEIEPTYMKSYIRKTRALLNLQMIDEAVETIK